MFPKEHKYTARLLCGAAVGALAMFASIAHADELPRIEIASQPLAKALGEFATQTKRAVLVTPDLTASRISHSVSGATDPEAALLAMLDGTGLTFRRDGDTFLIVRASDPQSGSAAGDGAEGTVQALIVTAQKREENIQDVPIAMSAFSQEELTRSQVATGADLMTQVPNMTFTKTNFTSYSIQIRGIGTQAISATVDPAVAVAFNNTPFLRAHFFEQEFYDLERVEVLRGPQGTLYGRNATAGVVNLISAKPKFHFEAKASADISNYSSHRLEGMLNLPLVEDKVALRLAGAWTKRDGFVTNELSGKPIDGRDLWSTRLSLRIEPTEKLRTNFIWEHFEEDDDRLRSGKQTCKRANAPDEVDGQTTHVPGYTVSDPQHYLDQGCDPASIYSPDAFQTPDGNTLPYYYPLKEVGAPLPTSTPGGMIFLEFDPYASAAQSRDLRVIESQIDPIYRASSDTVELNVDYDLTDNLTVSSQTGFQKDFLFSSQDYNRFNTRPGAWLYCKPDNSDCPVNQSENMNLRVTPKPGGPVLGPDAGSHWGDPCDPTLGFTCYTAGVFCDPQIGCSDRLLAMDLATARSRQFSQELRIASNFDGRFNFSLGANYLRYKTLEDYYVFINALTLGLTYRQHDYTGGVEMWQPGVSDNHMCLQRGFDYIDGSVEASPYGLGCNSYIDPNPITDLNGQGHNYFRNQNPYKVQSYALFGEAYYDITPDLKLTAGLRWTVDKKNFISIPSQVLVSGYGYPEAARIEQEWREPTGRLVMTWKPHLGFTDETMVYGSYTHGYKAGGANPPGAALVKFFSSDITNPIHPATFKAEFVDAYELGTKNTLLDGKLVFNLTGFYYDYSDYQISEIVDRSAINLNFDAKIWGMELETDWRPLENLRFGLKLGYEDTRVADGQKAVDLMDRTNGHDDWMVIKPFVTQASNCILPKYVVAALIPQSTLAGLGGAIESACGEAYQGLWDLGQVDPVTDAPYGAPPNTSSPIPADYPGFDPTTAPNNGAGFDKDLSGNALPNAPHWTTTLTADYTIPLPSEWLMTLHTDLYYQSEAWTRIFNLEGFDKLKAYTNVNVAAIFSNEDAGWMVMAYVKNVFDKDNITGAFLNSDDSGLTNNVFLNEPRLYGLRVTKNWTGAPWWGANGPTHKLPFHIEVEGYHGKLGGENSAFKPALADLYDADFQPPFGATQNDLAALNGGGVRLTWQPEGATWNLSGGIRYGRAGGGTYLFKRKDLEQACLINDKYCWNPSNLPGPTSELEGKYNWHRYFELTTHNEESHAFADFAVGKDFGLGSLGTTRIRNHVDVGVAYGQFKSSMKTEIHGMPDLDLPDNFFTYDSTNGYQFFTAHHHRIYDKVQAGREFKGFGPELNWEAAVDLFGDADQAGRVDLDVGLGAMVLFGRQKAAFSGTLEGAYHTNGQFSFPGGGYVTSSYINPLDIAPRKTSVTVPGVRADLGLSYTLGEVKVSGGYRLERYYNVIDGGWETREKRDRTFDGPYMKVSVGFGG